MRQRRRVIFVSIAVLSVALFLAFHEWTTGAEGNLSEKLLKGDVKALETVLKTPDQYSADVLYAGAGVAFKQKRLEDSAFLFYAGQLRARFDQKCFPPKGTGGDSPFLAYAALSQELGSTINPAVMAEPKTFANVFERIEKWNPKAPKEYTPGYEFKERLSEKDAHEAAKPNRTEFLGRMGDLSKLLNDAEYFAAFRVVQASNLASDDKRPTKEENALKGVFSK